MIGQKSNNFWILASYLSVCKEHGNWIGLVADMKNNLQKPFQSSFMSSIYSSLKSSSSFSI